MLKALEDQGNLVTYAAKQAGISRNTHYMWLQNDPEYAAAVKEIDEMVLDWGENQLKKLANGVLMTDDEGEVYQTAPNPAAVIFFNKTKGRKRGYAEKQTIELEGSTKVEVIDYSKLSDAALKEILAATKPPKED